jgi:DNA-binding NarL/FixJ family response regulator
MNVLLVEENRALRYILRQLVSSPGTWIQECVSSAEAIAAYAADRPDLVIIDISIKDVDGLTVCIEIRALDPQAKVILVSEFDDAAVRERAQSVGACGYVLKDNLLDVKYLLKALSASGRKADWN